MTGEPGDCPRCAGPLESYTLGDRETATCERCGWVGVDASLRDRGAAEPTDSWADAIDRVAGRHVSTDRNRAGLPPIAAADTPDDSAADGEARTAGADAPDGESKSVDAGESLEAMAWIEAPDADRLAAAGVRTVEELAGADPVGLAEAADIPEPRARTYVRRASIRVVASGDPAERR